MLAQRFGKQLLIEQARLVDAGMDEQVPVAMMWRLERLVDDQIPTEQDAVQTLCECFERWRSQLTGD